MGQHLCLWLGAWESGWVTLASRSPYQWILPVVPAFFRSVVAPFGWKSSSKLHFNARCAWSSLQSLVSCCNCNFVLKFEVAHAASMEVSDWNSVLSTGHACNIYLLNRGPTYGLDLIGQSMFVIQLTSILFVEGHVGVVNFFHTTSPPDTVMILHGMYMLHCPAAGLLASRAHAKPLAARCCHMQGQ